MILPAYDTYINADEYFQNRLHTLAWDEAASTEKTTALTEATQRIDRLRFTGVMVEDDQEMEFPRYYGDEPEGDEEIPDDIKIACYELAFALLDGVDPDLEAENLAVISQGYSSVRIAKSSMTPQDHIAAGIPNLTAWRHLVAYLAPDREIKIHRVS